MAIDPVVIIAYLFGLLMLYIAMRIVLLPVRFLTRVLLNGLIGAAGLLALNWAGQYWAAVDLYVPINPVTAVATGFLGVPGLIMLLALRHWLVAPLF